MRLEVEGNFLFLALVREDGADEQHQTVRRHPVVEFETLLGGGNGGEHGQSVDTRLDVGGRSVFLRQHVLHARYLILQRESASCSSKSAGMRTFGGMMRLIMEVPALWGAMSRAVGAAATVRLTPVQNQGS